MPQMMPMWWPVLLIFITLFFLTMSAYTYFSMIFFHEKKSDLSMIKAI